MCDNFNVNFRFGDIVKDIIKKYETNEQEILRYDDETQDILHEIEFSETNRERKIELYDNLAEIRNCRRKVKEENERLHPIYNVLTDEKNSRVIKQLKDTQKEINRIINRQQERKIRGYIPKVRTDLQCATKINDSIEELKKVAKNKNVGR